MARELKDDTEHKHMFKRGKVWWVTTMRDGKRTITSTKETDLKKARLVRDELLKPYDLRDEKKRVEAMISRVQTVDQHIAKIEDEKPSTTIRQGWQAYLDQHNRPDSGPVTLSQYEGWYEAFARWFEERYPKADKAGEPVPRELREVTQEQADEYAGQLLKRVSATTFNRHMNTLALVWRVMGKSARISGNPWKAIGRKRFTVHSRRELTVEELGRVFNAAQGEMRLLLALGTFCGLRLADAACLEWSSVDMVKGIISLVPRKTARRSQKRVTLPIHRALFEILAEIPERKRRGLVMPSMADRYNSYNAALAKDVADLFLSVDIKTNPNAKTKSEEAAEKQAFAEAKAKAKEEGKPAPNHKPKAKGDRVRADAGFHSLRHTFVSLCAAGGVSQSVVQALVGHGSPAMTQHYTHIDVLTAQNAVALLPDVTRANSSPEQPDATGAKLKSVLAMLGGLAKSELERVILIAQGFLAK